jgi:hypothetical protein
VALPTSNITGANWNDEFETLRNSIDEILTGNSGDGEAHVTLPFAFYALTTSSTERDNTFYFTPPMDCRASGLVLSVYGATASTVVTVTISPVSASKDLLGQSSDDHPTVTITTDGTTRDDVAANLQTNSRPGVLFKRGEEYKIVCTVSASIPWVSGGLGLTSEGRRV